jgi:hypothetical protein
VCDHWHKHFSLYVIIDKHFSLCVILNFLWHPRFCKKTFIFISLFNWNLQVFLFYKNRGPPLILHKPALLYRFTLLLYPIISLLWSTTTFVRILTIWFKDPRPFFIGDYDMWGTVDNESPIYYCAGFVAFKSSPLSEDLLEKWKSSLETPDLNQFKFNSLVKKIAIRHKPLPRKEFPGGHMYFIKQIVSTSEYITFCPRFMNCNMYVGLLLINTLYCLVLNSNTFSPI